MQSPEFIKNYQSNDKQRLAFNRLAVETFDIDFENWFQGRHWNDRYICYAYWDNKILSNASLNLMDLIIQGSQVKAIQIGTVMTHPDHRGKGLVTDLINRIIHDYADLANFFYLFCESELTTFYERFGFKELPQSSFWADIDPIESHKSQIRKLDFSKADNRKLANQLLIKRTPLSLTFGVNNAEHIVSWYTYNMLNNNFHYCPDEDMILVFEKQKHVVHLYDIISSQSVKFEQILNYISGPKINKVEFHFTPDKLDIQYITEAIQCSDKLMIKADSFNMTTPFKHPITARA